MYGTNGYTPDNSGTISAESVSTSAINTTYTVKTPQQIIDEEIASMEAMKKYYQDELRAVDAKIAFAKALKEKMPNSYTTLTGNPSLITTLPYIPPNDLSSIKITCDSTTNKEDTKL